MRKFKSSKALHASSCTRPQGRTRKYNWFAQNLDINHTGPTSVWLRRQSFSEEEKLALETFVRKPAEQPDTPYDSGKVILRSRPEHLYSTFDMAAKTAVQLDFGNNEEWPALNLGHQDESKQERAFTCEVPPQTRIWNDTQTSAPKYLSAAPAENESGWMFLSQRQLYIDIVKKDDLLSDCEKLSTGSSAVDIESIASCSDKSQWIMLAEESNSSDLSEEEDGLGEAMHPSATEVQSNSGSSLFSFLW